MFSTLVADPNIVDADIAMYDEVLPESLRTWTMEKTSGHREPRKGLPAIVS